MNGPGAFRLFLALVVVIHHSFPLRMGAWAVGLFFVLSGYWISRMWRRSYSKKPSPYLTFIISRWWRVAPLFVSVQVIAATLIMAGYTVGDSTVTTDWRWWVTQPLVVGSTQFGRLLPPSWSLDVEMQFYLAAPLIVGGLASYILGTVQPNVESQQTRNAADSTRRNGSMLFLMAVVLGIPIIWAFWCLQQGASLETPRLDVFLWLFVLGMVCELVGWKPSVAAAVMGIVALSLLIGFSLSSASTRGLIWSVGASVNQPVSSGATATFFILSTLAAVPFAIRTVHQESSAWDRWLGDLSYPLYLFHWLCRDWYYHNVDWSRPAWQNALLFMANVVGAIAGAVVLLQLIDRPAQRLRATWIANRAMHRNALKPTTANV